MICWGRWAISDIWWCGDEPLRSAIFRNLKTKLMTELKAVLSLVYSWLITLILREFEEGRYSRFIPLRSLPITDMSPRDDKTKRKCVGRCLRAMLDTFRSMNLNIPLAFQHRRLYCDEIKRRRREERELELNDNSRAWVIYDLSNWRKAWSDISPTLYL